MSGANGTITARIDRDGDNVTGPGEVHTDTVTTFRDLNVDAPFDYGDAVYDPDRGIARIPKAIGPNGDDTDGFRVYCSTYEVRETRTGDLKITDAGTPGMRGISMKLLLVLLDEDATRVVNADRIKA